MATNSHGIRILDAAPGRSGAAHDARLDAEFRKLVRDRDTAGAIRFMSLHLQRLERILRDSSVADIPFRIGNGHRYVKIPAMAEAVMWSTELDAPNWAPWLRYSAEMFMLMMKVFPEGQIQMRDGSGRLIAGLNTVRVNWDGTQGTLPRLGDLIRNAEAFEESYSPNGNTLFMVKMSVAQDQQGSGLPSRCIDILRETAVMLEVSHVIGAFRPNGFGRYKLENGPDSSFLSYCYKKRSDGLPVDAWIRNLVRNGMVPITIDRLALTKLAPIEEFRRYMTTYKAGEWRMFVADPTSLEGAGERWECGETGRWDVPAHIGSAIYTEPRLMGRIPINPA